MIQNCNEQLLDDVVRVDLVLASECKIDIPFQIAKTDMPGTRVVNGSPTDIIGAPGLSLAYNVQDGDDGEMDSAPYLKQTEKQQAAGIVVSHDLQVPVTAGFEFPRGSHHAGRRALPALFAAQHQPPAARRTGCQPHRHRQGHAAKHEPRHPTDIRTVIVPYIYK